jgi:FtsH-binding integral membrane protein
LFPGRLRKAEVYFTVGIFFPFSKTIDLVYALGGTFLFSGYVIYDVRIPLRALDTTTNLYKPQTFLITKKLSPDEFIVGAVSLYLDFINLCKPSLIFDNRTSF